MSRAAAGFTAAYLAGLPYELDPFQRRAIDALEAGRSVLVSAPTGSGKTEVANYAVARTLATGRRACYTTPLKALSNQKHRELCEVYGEESVGLLTGDVSHQGDAPVVVMTTEVLRNMLLSRSAWVDDVDLVVLDEVHFLEDPYRGPVWEEVVVLTPKRVTFVSLSATVTNAAELGAWLRSVRGPTTVVEETARPIELDEHAAITRGRHGAVDLVPLFQGSALNPLLAERERAHPRDRARRSRPPRRTDLVESLAERDMLPAIVFIFSRAACDDAAWYCVQDGLRFTTGEERARIRSIVEAATEGLSDEDLATLGYGRWLTELEAGIAPHHAGLVPAFRRAAELCFEAGLLKVVFATETLALGINMPARTVVIDRFAKFRGSERTPLTPNEYRQLTGRAGRRGIDHEGHAVVAASPTVPFTEVARVARAAPAPLKSAFEPTYNLAVNLVAHFSPADAAAVVAASFGQWQAPPGSVSLRARFARRLQLLETRGYVEGWSVTELGGRLAGIYHESDLLVAEAIRHGLFDGLGPGELAAVASSIVFESREGPDTARSAPPASLVGPLGALADLAAELRSAERALGIRRTRRPDPGLADAVDRWAQGRSLARSLERTDVAPGDFVRNVRQLIDLLRQVGQVAPGGVATAVESAVASLKRGVVAAWDVPVGEVAPGLGSATPGEPGA